MLHSQLRAGKGWLEASPGGEGLTSTAAFPPEGCYLPFLILFLI